MDPFMIAMIVWLLLPFLLLVLWLRARKKAKIAQEKVAAVETALKGEVSEKEGETKTARSEASTLKSSIEALNTTIATHLKTIEELRPKAAPVEGMEAKIKALTARYDDLNAQTKRVEIEYKHKKEVYDKLRSQVAIYDEKLSFAELGIYEPHFDFSDTEQFKHHITTVRDKQKKMVSMKTACIVPDNWTVDGSLSKGKTMVNRQMRLTMRAFNNECEAAIANTRWNNVVAMEKRVLNAAKQINAANESLKVSISEKYVSLKIDELHLTHEYREQQKIEKDERAELARLEREEKALIKAAEKAEQEEVKYQALLDKARAEAGTEAQSEEMQQRIAELEKALAEAHTESERARAMAEMTKSGFVYIISNVGSFGEDVVKIGLTRRMNPDDRVKELGDASVPFSFDTHAMIYSDEAPALEAALHKEFAKQRINMSNMRKEFFRVSLEEVENAVSRLAPDATFFKDREAQEWHETMARRNEMLEAQIAAKDEEFPNKI